jgi:hypothetical protein
MASNLSMTLKIQITQALANASVSLSSFSVVTELLACILTKLGALQHAELPQLLVTVLPDVFVLAFVLPSEKQGTASRIWTEGTAILNGEARNTVFGDVRTRLAGLILSTDVHLR